MLCILEVLTVALVGVAMGLSLAHALELPGKRRLGRDAYFATQPMYYPGFTIGGGVGEGGATLATVALLITQPVAAPAFWLTLVALLGLVGMHVVYWGLTHPVNRVWLRGQSLGSLGEGFFGLGKSESQPDSWTQFRDRWEYSHVARAALAGMSFVALVVAPRAPR
jgi:hypothetical protein